MSLPERIFRATERENRRLILDTLPVSPGAALLDVGAHRGDFTAELARRSGAAHVAAVEMIPAHAAAVAARGFEATVADVEEGLPYPDEAFDLVHSNQLIEHLRRTDVLLGEVRRVLRPGGSALISTNNLSSWHNVASLTLGWQPFPLHVSDERIVGNPLNPEAGRPHEDAGRVHVRLFTARALRELAEHHGLRCVRMRAAGYYPLPPAAARAAARLDPRHAAFLVGLFERAR